MRPENPCPNRHKSTIRNHNSIDTRGPFFIYSAPRKTGPYRSSLIILDILVVGGDWSKPSRVLKSFLFGQAVQKWTNARRAKAEEGGVYEKYVER